MSSAAAAEIVPRVRDALRLDAGEPLMVIVGSGVSDVFVSTAYQEMALDQALLHLLRAGGFRLVMFSSVNEPGYFLDEQSRALFESAGLSGMNGGGVRKIRQAANSRQPRRAGAGARGATAHDVLDVPATGSVASRQGMSAVTASVGVGNRQRTSQRSARARAVEMINTGMRMPEDIPTAVVIVRAEHFLKSVGGEQDLAEWFAEWQQASAAIGNICVLVFTSRSWDGAVDYVRSLGHMNSLVAHLERQGGRAGERGIGEIGEPDAAEIERIIHIARLRHGLRIADWRELDRIIAALAAQPGVLAVNWARRLRGLARSGGELSEQTLRSRGWVETLPGGRSAWDRLTGLTGLAEVKEHIDRLRWQAEAEAKRRREGLLAEYDSLHLVFTGRPGTGKTTVARLIGELYREMGLLRRGHLHAPEASDLIGMYVGHTAVQTNRAVDAALDGVLFIDEAYRLSEQPGGFGQEAIDTLVTRMDNDRGRLVVVVAGYPDKMEAFLRSNPGLPRRFPRSNRIAFPDYEPDALFTILVGMLGSRGLSWVPELEPVLRRVVAGLYAARDETFGNAGEMRNLAREFETNWARRVKAVITEPVTPEDLPAPYRSYL